MGPATHSPPTEHAVNANPAMRGSLESPAGLEPATPSVAANAERPCESRKSLHLSRATRRPPTAWRTILHPRATALPRIDEDPRTAHLVKHAPQGRNQRLVVTVVARDNEHVDVRLLMGTLSPRARAIQPHRIEVVAVRLLERGHKPTEELSSRSSRAASAGCAMCAPVRPRRDAPTPSWGARSRPSSDAGQLAAPSRAKR